ncbi:MAG: serine/threonine-protein phosphatase [Candidatus Omnitrophica bacterium]|nr:serine/threonine-protein phosphatase [Candidatus Omnitrophota bacterium]
MKIKNYDKLLKMGYVDEFNSAQAPLVKNRIYLFGFLAVAIYTLSSLMSNILMPGGFHKDEIPVITILLFGTLILLLVNRAVNTLKGSKVTGYALTLLLVFILTRLNIIYHAQIHYNITAYLLMLFLVSFSIPWKPSNIFVVWYFHLGAFMYLYAYVSSNLPEYSRVYFTEEDFYSGLILMTLGFVQCYVIRKKEYERDIENFLLFKDVETKNAQMNSELDLATRVHMTLIPRSLSDALVDVTVTYYPVDGMGGDYAKFEYIDDKRLLFFICDVTGHGVPAALLVNRVHAEFYNFARNGTGPAELLSGINRFILKDFEGTEMYLTAFSCVLDLEKRSMVYANCGHPSQYLYSTKDSRALELTPMSTMLGISFADNSVEEGRLGISRGDKIVLFTDGLLETTDATGEPYESLRIIKFIENNHGTGPGEFNSALLNDVKRFNGDKFADDVFLMTVDIK